MLKLKTTQIIAKESLETEQKARAEVVQVEPVDADEVIKANTIKTDKQDK